MTGPLDRLRIATPCLASWEAMRGDHRVRFCALCRLNVYDVSHMTERDARALIERTEGRVCVRLWRRSDGTVLTRDCPRAAGEALRDGLRVLLGGLVALALLIGASSTLARAAREIMSVILSFGSSTGKLAG